MAERISSPRPAWHSSPRSLWAWRLRRLRQGEERQYGEISLIRTSLSMYVQKKGDEKKRFRMSSYAGTIEATLSYLLELEGIEQEQEEDHMSEMQAINEAQIAALKSIADGGPLPHHKTLAALERRGLIERDGEEWRATSAGLKLLAKPEWAPAKPEIELGEPAPEGRDAMNASATLAVAAAVQPETDEIGVQVDPLREDVALRALRYIMQEVPAARRVVVLFAELERATEALKDGDDVG